MAWHGMVQVTLGLDRLVGTSLYGRGQVTRGAHYCPWSSCPDHQGLGRPVHSRGQVSLSSCPPASAPTQVLHVSHVLHVPQVLHVLHVPHVLQSLEEVVGLGLLGGDSPGLLGRVGVEVEVLVQEEVQEVQVKKEVQVQVQDEVQV